MNTKFLGILATVSLFVAGPALAECSTHANPPAIPDGTGATTEQMTSASASVKGYMADMQDFLKCLENDKAGGSAKYNAAVDQMQSIANEFNKQLRAFKAKG
ncbi:hypothetical protein UCD39_11280 [Nitrospirillum sp. BR 11752]|uniref:Uncharacterized protein n=1 Tax=Nitrospirillum amazonense TaxID=28077 RepID=A0A560HC21_9PROT|nr:hypothetical protein [Nitrospirillum amazonense]MEE3624567.1 hypothetical protein [Nitrospirillum sp. BR 11752]TWB43269.1 hypothetical protein FBZ90_10582 [Nitrospirillum amazonense]